MPIDRDHLAFMSLWGYAFAGLSKTLRYLYERQASCMSLHSFAMYDIGGSWLEIGRFSVARPTIATVGSGYRG